MAWLTAKNSNDGAFPVFVTQQKIKSSWMWKTKPVKWPHLKTFTPLRISRWMGLSIDTSFGVISSVPKISFITGSVPKFCRLIWSIFCKANEFLCHFSSPPLGWAEWAQWANKHTTKECPSHLLRKQWMQWLLSVCLGKINLCVVYSQIW